MDLVVAFPSGAALSGVTARLRPGTHAAVVGPAGSGKTTLLKALAGLITPSGGGVRWDGVDPFALDVAARRAAQARIGMVFQNDALFDSLSVLENVRLPLERRGVRAAEATSRAEAALQAVGLLAFAAQLPATLSGGMRKRVGVARAVVARPSVLIADDPFAGLDPKTAAAVAGVLRDAAAGRTLLVALPDPVLELALPRVLHLAGGALQADTEATASEPPCAPPEPAATSATERQGPPLPTSEAPPPKDGASG